MFTSVDLFNGHHSALIAVAVGPAALVAVILIAPLLLGRGGGGQSRSARLELLRARVARDAGAPARRHARVPRAAPRGDRGRPGSSAPGCSNAPPATCC